MDDIKQPALDLWTDVTKAAEKIDLNGLAAKQQTLEQQMQNPNFWQQADHAQTVVREKAKIEKRIAPWQALLSDVDDLLQLFDLQDDTMRGELSEQLDGLTERFAALKKELAFSGPYDEHDVIITIYAGAGGTDAQDWAQMLLRMYVRWAEAHKYKITMIDESPGEEAGLKSATFEIDGDFLYGKLKGEHGVHRLVRLSPFNSAASRETSFAKVDVLPKIDRPGDLELDEKDLRIDVYRSGGHGGQSVNTTDSAVRITHIPTGIAVAIQNERSQLQNKETALTILRSKLAGLQLEQHKEKLSELKGPTQAVEFGSQIRNYVLHPYKQVKDLRSGFETSDPESVLQGNLDQFINAYLETNLG